VNTNWVQGVTRVEAPAIVDWRTAHPLLRYSGFDNVQVMSSLTVKTPSWAVSLADAPQAPLILAGELGRQRIIWIGFDILESNWPLRVSFPIFIANAVEWLNPANARGGQLLVKAGDAFRLALTQPETSAQVTLPGGAHKTLSIDSKANEFVFGDTMRQGVYRVIWARTIWLFAWTCSMQRRATSNRATSCNWANIPKLQPQKCRAQIWSCGERLPPWVLLVLLGEWWFYHRRTV